MGITILPEAHQEFLDSLKWTCKHCGSLRERHEFASDRCPTGDGEFSNTGEFEDAGGSQKPGTGTK